MATMAARAELAELARPERASPDHLGRLARPERASPDPVVLKVLVEHQGREFLRFQGQVDHFIL
jgi:hypothetical protein